MLDITKKNVTDYWTNKITKLKHVLEIWKCRRNLTLFGKVQVIKCLAMAGLIYTATNCALPSHDIISTINSEIYNFLWGKSEKIKRRVLINSIENGGINMVDIKSQFDSLKAAWIPRLIHDQDNHGGHWKDLPLHFLNKLGNSLFILETNITDFKTQNLPTIPKFYKEVITAFNRSKLTVKEEFTSNLLHQPIFGNKYITYVQGNKSKCPYFVHWINSGIKYLKDLKIDNGKIDIKYIHNEITNKRNIHNEILIVILCLKEHLKHISNDPSNTITIKHSNTNKMKKAKYFYLRLVSQIQEKPYVENKWTRSMNMDITFKDVYFRKISNIKDKKIAEVNYKIIHNILPCGVNLLKWKKKDNDKCEICGNKETIEHLIFECPYASTLWSKLQDTFNIKLELQNILFGIAMQPYMTMITSLLAYLIYKEWVNLSLHNKTREITPSFTRYANELEYCRLVYINIQKLSQYNTYIEQLVSSFSV